MTKGQIVLNVCANWLTQPASGPMELGAMEKRPMKPNRNGPRQCGHFPSHQNYKEPKDSSLSVMENWRCHERRDDAAVHGEVRRAAFTR